LSSAETQREVALGLEIEIGFQYRRSPEPEFEVGAGERDLLPLRSAGVLIGLRPDDDSICSEGAPFGVPMIANGNIAAQFTAIGVGRC